MRRDTLQWRESRAKTNLKEKKKHTIGKHPRRCVRSYLRRYRYNAESCEVRTGCPIVLMTRRLLGKNISTKVGLLSSLFSSKLERSILKSPENWNDSIVNIERNNVLMRIQLTGKQREEDNDRIFPSLVSSAFDTTGRNVFVNNNNRFLRSSREGPSNRVLRLGDALYIYYNFFSRTKKLATLLKRKKKKL